MKSNIIPKSAEERKTTYSATENIKSIIEINIPVYIKGSKVHLEFAVHPGQILFEVLYQPASVFALDDIYPNPQKISSISELDDNKDSKDNKNNNNSNSNNNNNDKDSEKRRSITSITTSSRKSIVKTGSKAIVGPVKVGNYIGSWTSEEEGGTLFVRFDNSGSWLAAKVLTYFIEVEEPDPEILYKNELKELERQRLTEEEEQQRKQKELEFQSYISKLEEELQIKRLQYDKLHAQHKDLHEIHTNVKEINTNIEEELQIKKLQFDELHAQHKDLHEIHTNVKEINTNFLKELETAKTDIASLKVLEKAFFSANETISKLESKLKSSDIESNNLKTILNSNSKEIDSLKEQIKSLKVSNDTDSKQYNEDIKAKMKLIQELQVKLKAREIEYDKLHVILQSSSSENDQLKNRLGAIKEADSKVEARDREINGLNAKIESLVNKNEELRMKVDIMQSELDSQINIKVDIENRHTVLEAAFLAANEMINKLEQEKIQCQNELIHTKNLFESKGNDYDDLNSTLTEVKRVLTVTTRDLDQSKHEYSTLKSQFDIVNEANSEYKNALNTLAPKEHENFKLLEILKELEVKLVTSNNSKLEVESKLEKLMSNFDQEVNSKAAHLVGDIQLKLDATNSEKLQLQHQLEIVKKDLQSEIDLYSALMMTKVNLEAQLNEAQIKNLTFESKIIDYERVRTRLELNISELVTMKNALESKLASPQISSHEATIQEYEKKLVNVDEGYRSIVNQLEERIALIEEENNNLKENKLKSDKEFADLIYSASVSASTAEAKIRDLEVQHSKASSIAEAKAKNSVQGLMNLHRDEILELNGLHKNQITELQSNFDEKLYEISLEVLSLKEANKNLVRTHDDKMMEQEKNHISKLKEVDKVLKAMEDKLNEALSENKGYSDTSNDLQKMKINYDQLTERLHVQEKDISELRSTIKKLSADNESLESQVRVYKMYKSKVTDLAEKIDADDIIPKDLESCHREIVSLRASRQLLQSIRKSLEDQNLTLKNKVEELESKKNVSNDKSNEEIVSKTESERKKRTSILGYFSLSPPTEKSSSLQSQVDSPSNTQSVSEKKDEINSIVPIPQPPLEVKKDSDSSPGQKPQPPIEGQPSSVQPMLIKPKEDAPRSPSTFNIAEFFSNL